MDISAKILVLCCSLLVLGELVRAQIAMPSQYYPNAAARPRTWVLNDLNRLKAAWNDPNNAAALAFKHDLTKLMSYSVYTQDWHYGSGWPCAALALAYQITGSSSYADKAINVFMNYFTGNPIVSGRLQSVTHFAYCYDWLYDYPNFTPTLKQTLRNKLISWSDQEFFIDNDPLNPTYVAQDSDHMTAATTSHLVAGVAIYGDDPAAINLLNRGWTGWKIGFNNNPGLPNVSIETMYGVQLENGHPLPGWDYCFMSDCWDLANSWYVLDELGYVNPTLTSYWPATIVNFIHNIDPANTHFRWLGDTQSTPYLEDYTGEIWSYFTNSIYNAERYGFTKEAAWGRYFLDTLHHPSYGIPEGDTMLWFSRSYDAAAPRINYKTDPSFPRYIVAGLGTDQKMGFGYFRSSWAPTATWGGFAGVGNYLVDHQNNIHGSFFLWRNGEYLTTDPHQYGGQTGGPIWNNLEIINSVEPDNGGPIWYYNQGAAFLARGRVVTGAQDLFYSMLNADKSYNLPYKQWSPCDICRTPVSTYRRHFVYDGGDYALVVDWVTLNTAATTGWRIRTQNPNIAPTVLGNNELSLPSDLGGYRTLVRFLSPTPSSVGWTVTDETDLFTANGVDNWQIDQNHWGYSCKATTIATSLKHVWITALHLGASNAGITQLDSAVLITDANSTPIGAYFGNTIFLSNDGYFAAPVSFVTPATVAAGTRVLVADLQGGCYIATSNGVLVGLYSAVDEDNTILFNLPIAGSQTIVVSVSSDCVPPAPPAPPAPGTDTSGGGVAPGTGGTTDPNGGTPGTGGAPPSSGGGVTTPTTDDSGKGGKGDKGDKGDNNSNGKNKGGKGKKNKHKKNGKGRGRGKKGGKGKNGHHRAMI